MWLKLDIDGIELKFRISGYKPICDWEKNYSWCQVDLQLNNSWIDYEINGELLDMGEVLSLENRISDLLSGKVSEVKDFECLEPDLQFRFYPKLDIFNDPKIIYVALGHEIADLSADLSITFWNKGLTNNRLILQLDRDDLEFLHDYLLYTEDREKLDLPKLDALIESGVFLKEIS